MISEEIVIANYSYYVASHSTGLYFLATVLNSVIITFI